MSDLFRPEVLNSAPRSYFGSARLGHQPLLSAITVAVALVGFLLLTFVCVGEIPRKVKVSGLIAPSLGNLPLVANATGVIREVRITEGEETRGGNILVVIATGRSTGHGPTGNLVAQGISARRKAVESESTTRDHQAAHKIEALSRRTKHLQREIRESDEESDLLTRRISLAKRTVDRYEALADEGFVSTLQVQRHHEDLMELQGRLHAARKSRSVLEREVLDMAAEIASTEAQRTAEAWQLRRQQAALQQESVENEERREIVIAAPGDATVTALTAKVGQVVQEGQPLMTLVPRDSRTAGRLEAELFAPSRAIGFVAPGQLVLLRLAAFPYQKFGLQRGRVTAISRTPLGAQELPSGQAASLLQAAQTSEPLYRIKVALDAESIRAYGRDVMLKPGMVLEADIHQERRTILEWLFEPLIAVGRRI
ncbi:hypothetical protein CDN99_10055 [Roseateles aquatilis]|uniref:AprE-like beta-barrel domain-containing protein n=1 Tax=Roseateles aquatilis TaxID=431061 RepID=A0A246JFU4_9BURK|nr:HlyD family efflux transporter periplasmic adaptor subunit [Roseateles aquatilis]OWQ91485.1 hypothetical protein CDN99_10055 [Roseateles aquatilis]